MRPLINLIEEPSLKALSLQKLLRANPVSSEPGLACGLHKAVECRSLNIAAVLPDIRLLILKTSLLRQDMAKGKQPLSSSINMEHSFIWII